MKLLLRKEKLSARKKARAEQKLANMFEDVLGTMPTAEGARATEAKVAASMAKEAEGRSTAAATVRKGSKNVKVTGRKKRKLARKADLAEGVADMTTARLEKLEKKRSRKERVKNLY